MDQHRPGTKVAEQLLTRPEGATMDEVIQATGSPQYNYLKTLEGRGYTIRRNKEGRATRYWAIAPAAQTFEASVTAQGQVTIPKPVREKMGVHAGSKVRFVFEPDGRVFLGPSELSVQRLFGMLGKPPRGATIDEMNTAARDGAVQRYLRSRG